MYVISYTHSYEGNIYHGTLSSIEGITKTSWSFEVEGERQTIHDVITPLTFQTLWSMFKASHYIASCVTRNSDIVIDPITHHLINAAFDLQGKQGNILTAIPANSNHPEFKAWIALLNMPLQS